MLSEVESLRNAKQEVVIVEVAQPKVQEPEEKPQEVVKDAPVVIESPVPAKDAPEVKEEEKKQENSEQNNNNAENDQDKEKKYDLHLFLHIV